jgi:hypothetical protein
MSVIKTRSGTSPTKMASECLSIQLAFRVFSGTCAATNMHGVLLLDGSELQSAKLLSVME